MAGPGRPSAPYRRGEIDPVATGSQGETVMKLIDAIYASGEQTREVAIS